MKIVLIVLGCLLVLFLAGCGYLRYMFEGPRTWPTYKGVESPEVLNGIHGEVAFAPGGEAAVQRIGDTSSTTIFKGTEDVRSHTVGGPDLEGRIALVDNDMMAKRHALRVISPDGTTETLFDRAGDALWGDMDTDIKPINENIAMSRSGRIAILVTLKGKQFDNPPMYLEQGTLEIWDPNAKKAKKIDLQCLDSGMSWFPDNRRLAVVRVLGAGDLRSKKLGPSVLGDSYGGAEVPGVWIVDTESGKAEPFSGGGHPIVSADGKFMSVEDADGNVRIIDVATHSATAATLPGQCGDVIGLTSDGRVIYWAIATEGVKVQSTKSNGLPGPRPMLTIKAVDLKTGKFATIVPSIDPRSEASFGFLR